MSTAGRLLKFSVPSSKPLAPEARWCRSAPTEATVIVPPANHGRCSFGIASFRIAGYVIWPFGRTVVWQREAGIWSVIGNILWLVLGTPVMTASWAALGVGLGAVIRNQVFAVIGLIVWTMVIDNLLIGLVPKIGGYTLMGVSGAITSYPADYVLSAAAGALLLLGYVVTFVAAGALLVARRDVT